MILTGRSVLDYTLGIRWESSMLDLYERLRVYICIYKHVIEQAKVWGGSWRSIRRFSRVCNLRDNRLAVNPFRGPNCSFARIYVIYTLRFTKKSELVGAWFWDRTESEDDSHRVHLRKISFSGKPVSSGY